MDDGATTTVKVCVLGNGSAGKTSLCQRLKEDGFQRVYKQTIGIDWIQKNIRIRGKDVVLQLWDIGGQSLASTMMGPYIMSTDIAFVVYDVTDVQSFNDVNDWLAVFRREVNKIKQQDAAAFKNMPHMYLVGNKIDLQHLRKVSEEQHDKLIAQQQLKGGYFISARSGDNVLKSFVQATGSRLGIELTQEELEYAEKVLGVTVVRGDDEARTAEADRIEAEDRAAEARKHAKGCCSLQ
jgi:Ras-related protein Rab-28